jgi:transposase
MRCRVILQKTTTRYTPMPSPIANPIREAIIQRHQKGESLRSISDEMNLSYETVKNLWQHWLKTGRIEPNYEQAKRRGTRQFQALCEQAIQLKRDHPRWGAQLIQMELQIESETRLPSIRTLQRWFREAGVNRSANIQQQRVKTVQRGQRVHQVWAVDAKEAIRLQDGSWASWLVITDEASGAILTTRVFPPA